MFNNLKKRINNNELTVGTWIQTGSSELMEMTSLYDFDWITIDMEHTRISNQDFANLLRCSRGIPVFSRVRENDTLTIRQVLDLGAAGVIVPLIGNAEQARRAVAAAKFPPVGIRGFAHFRANEYGTNFDEYVKEANDSIVVIAMIETKEAIENIDEILDVEGIDGIIMGPYDLSGSYGIPGQVASPVVRDAMAKVVEACRRHNKPAGMHQVGIVKEQIDHVFNEGFRFIAIGMDTCFYLTGLDKAFELINKAKEGK